MHPLTRLSGVQRLSKVGGGRCLPPDDATYDSRSNVIEATSAMGNKSAGTFDANDN
jgi:hypothetical protein